MSVRGAELNPRAVNYDVEDDLFRVNQKSPGNSIRWTMVYAKWNLGLFNRNSQRDQFLVNQRAGNVRPAGSPIFSPVSRFPPQATQIMSPLPTGAWQLGHRFLLLVASSDIGPAPSFTLPRRAQAPRCDTVLQARQEVVQTHLAQNGQSAADDYCKAAEHGLHAGGRKLRYVAAAHTGLRRPEAIAQHEQPTPSFSNYGP